MVLSMKNAVCAAAVTVILSSVSAFAGGYSDPVVEPVITETVIEENTAASSANDNWVGGLMILLVLAAAAS